METGKQGFVGTSAPVSSVSAQREDRMHGLPRPLTAVYLQPPSAQDALTFPLSLCSKPFLTLHVAGGMPLQPQVHQRAGVTVPTARPKSAGKHVCRYCGRDCLKPSVLEKHLRCHTGERPYPCTVCGVAFKTQSNLYKHKRTQAHARLSCDSERDSVSSQESMQGSRDSCWSHPTPEAARDRPDSFERETPVTATGLTQTPAVQGKVGSDTRWALQQAALVGLILAPVDRNQEKLCSIVQKVEQSSGTGPKLGTSKEESSAPLTPNRHLPLQRQVATLFSKKWDPRALVGKSQSHDSTDSGFSEGSEQPWTSSQHDHSMESLTESSIEEPVDQRPHQVPTDTPSNGAKSQVSVLEKKKLEERISKLISENNALVDDKRLETVRPRKTVLSKQGSIDLPMPYTYKDSFHFEMKAPDRSERKAKQAFYNSVPTQLTNSPEHTPLVRSSSLPFSASSSGSKRTSLPSVYQQEAVLLGRWGSSGQIDPSLLARSVDQPASHHRSLVRQKAVDCLPAAEGLSVASSTEESFPNRLGLEGESVDAESSSGKCRRKKAQKFSYNKWYMYGGGTFTKLYGMDKSSDRDTCKAKKPVVSMGPEKAQEIQDKNMVIVRERGISGVTTLDLRSNISDIESSYHPPHLSVHLPSGSNMQEPSKLTSTKSFLQNPVRKDLTVSMQQCLGKIQVSSNSKEIGGGAVKDVSQEEQSWRLLPPQFINDLPSERKKQRTDESMCKLSVDTEGKQHNVLSHVFGANAIHGENQLLPAIQIGTTQKYSNRTAQNNNGIQQNKRTDFNLCSIDLHLNQKYFQLKEHKSLYQDNLRKQSTESSFLPKYQLKLPQSMDSGTITSFLPSASAESHMAISTSAESHSATSTTGSTKGHRDTLCLASLEIATPTPGSLESDTVTSTPTSLESHTATPIPVSLERDAATLTLASLDSDTTMSTSTSLESDTAMPTPDLLESHAATPIPASVESKYVTPTSNSAESYNDMTTSSCDNASIRFSIGESSTSSYVPQSEGKVTFLIDTSHIATEDVGFVKGQTGDIQIFLQVISCEELLPKETQLNAQDAKQAVSCPDISPTEAEIPEANIQNVSTILHPKELVCQDTPHSLCTAQESVSKDVTQSVPRGKVFTSESAVPSTHVGWRAFSPTDSQQNQNNGEPSYSESANLNNQASSSQIKNTDDCQDRPADQRTESLELRSDPDKPNSARQETEIHNQGGPTDQEGVLGAKRTVSPCEKGHQDVLSISMEKCAPAKLVEKWDDSESAEPTVGPSISQPAPIQEAPHHSPSRAVSTDRSTWVTVHSPNDNPKAIFLSTQEPPHLKAQKNTGRSKIAVTGHKHRPPPSPHSSKTCVLSKCLDGTITTRQAPLQSKPPSTGLGNKETTAVKGKGGQGALSMEPLPSTSVSEFQSLAGKPASTDRLKDDCDLTKPTAQRHACLRTDLAGPLGEHGSGTQIQKSPLSTKQETPLPTAGQEVSVSAAQRDTAAAPLCKTERKLPEVPLHGRSTETFLLGSSAAPKVSVQEPDSAVPPGQHQHSLASDSSPSPPAALETSSGGVLLQARLANQRIPSSASDLKTNCDQQLVNKVIDLGETEPERVHLVHADIHKARTLQSGEPGPEAIQPKAHDTPSETEFPPAGQAVGASQPARGPTRCSGIEYGGGTTAERRETELNYRGPTPQCVLEERSDNAATSRCLGNTREASQGLDTGLLQRVSPSTSTPLKEWRSMGLGTEHGCGQPELGGQRNDALGNSEVDQGATKGVQKEGGTRTESPVSGGMEEPGRGGLLTTPFSLWQREGVATVGQEERPKVDETNTCRHCGTSTFGLQSPAPNETKARQAQDETGTIHMPRSKASVQGEVNGSCALGPSATSETSVKRSLRFPLQSDAEGFRALQLSDKGASTELCKNRHLAFNTFWDRTSCQMENLRKIPSSSAGRGERDPLDVHSPDTHRPLTISCTPGIPPLSLDLNRLVGEVGVTGPTTTAGVDSAPGMGNLLPHDRTSTRPTWTSLRSHLPFPPSASSALSPALSCVRTRGLEEAPARAGKGDQEGEADSSSSDDEGKLVIELE